MESTLGTEAVMVCEIIEKQCFPTGLTRKKQKPNMTPNLLAGQVTVGGELVTADLSDRMLEIASQVTARLVGASRVQALTGGRQVIEGVVRSAKWVDTTAGYREISTLKMTVEMGRRSAGVRDRPGRDPGRLDRWGDLRWGDLRWGDLRWGRRVEFTATVEVSDNDPAFGFYSRPSRASLVGPVAA